MCASYPKKRQKAFGLLPLSLCKSFSGPLVIPVARRWAAGGPVGICVVGVYRTNARRVLIPIIVLDHTNIRGCSVRVQV